MLACLRSSSERDSCNVIVADQSVAGLGSTAMNDVEHSWRKARFIAQFAEHGSRHRCDFRWLGHDGVSGSERWCDLPGEKIQRQIPRRDARYRTQGFP